MRVTATTRRFWWLDVLRSHKDIPALDAEDGSPERKAGLLLIGIDDLRRAGLNVIQSISLDDDYRHGRKGRMRPFARSCMHDLDGPHMS